MDNVYYPSNGETVPGASVAAPGDRVPASSGRPDAFSELVPRQSRCGAQLAREVDHAPVGDVDFEWRVNRRILPR